MSLPKLPGMQIQDPGKANFRKSQALAFRNGFPVYDDKPGIGGDALPGQGSSKNQSAVKLTRYNVAGGSNDAAAGSETVPAWLAFDKKVLHFEGYFKEAVHESPDEAYRVRKMVINYFLEDESMSVVEPRQENSGIPQGVFLKRHQVPKPDADGDHYRVHDLNLGMELPLYGRVVRVINCDEFTRNFMSGIGITLNEPEEYPRDPYSNKRRELKERMNARHLRSTKNDRLRQFLEQDGQVLRFFAIWDDRKSLFGDRRRFHVHYYLADDSIEVLERIESNAGRDPFPVFMKRGKPNGHVGYKPSDLRIGAEIEVYGRTFLLYDADAFTKGYLRDHFGINEFPDVKIEEEAPAVPPRVIPPYNGFGSEEDSLASCQSLLAHGPRRDLHKTTQNDGKVLRWAARLETTRPVDKERRFVISFYLGDETIGVFEPQQRNSGVVGGNFLRRTRVKNPATGSYFVQTDLFSGAQVEIFKHKFILEEADEFALVYMEQHADQFPKSNAALVLGALQRNQQQRDAVLSQVAAKAAVGSGVVSTKEFKETLAAATDLSAQEVTTLTRHLDAKHSGEIRVADVHAAMTA